MSAEAPLDLAAVVVAFHPTDEVRSRLVKYVGFFSHVVVVDNTEGVPALAGVEHAPRLTYLYMSVNLGVAEALNRGVRIACALGYRHVMLLDQDSEATREGVALAFAACVGDVGVAAMRPVLAGRVRPTDDRGASHDIPMAMTSGSVLSLDAYRACGDFDAQLFIDYVDYEYCLRLKRQGFRIVEVPGAFLKHALGAPRSVRIVGRCVRYVSHAPFRSYYRVRNGLHVAATYFCDNPRAVLPIANVLLKEVVKALFVEDRRLERLAFMLTGLNHWARGRFGRLGEA